MQNSSTIGNGSLVQQRVMDYYMLRDAGLLQREGEFFPSVHYPPITKYWPITDDDLFASYKLPEDGKFDIYAHLPFCRQRCAFCHYPLQLGNKHEDEKEHYLDAIEREIDIYLSRLGVDRLKARSVLVGGGTPTFLTPAQLERFLEFFAHRIDLGECTQFSYDVDPVTLLGDEGMRRLEIMRQYGVDRLTIGVQSLDDRVLHLMNRHHTVDEAVDSICISQEMGFQINIEFIFNYPGQSLEDWTRVINQAVTLDVEEIQLYRLKVDAYGDYQGPIRDLLARGKVRAPTIEETVIMKQTAIEILAEHGYHENLRRVFTRKPEHYSHYAHNQCCALLDQVGFGLTAFSSLGDRFALNTQYFPEYYQRIAEGHLPINRGLVRDRDDQMRWSIVLPLKNRSVLKSDFAAKTGSSLDEVFRAKIERLAEFGLVSEDDSKIELTPLGAFFADEMAQQFHAPNLMPYPPEQYMDGPLHPYRNCMPWGSDCAVANSGAVPA